MIKAKVADLIDERTLILNKGKKQGVRVGMKFMIYAASDKKIIDPDTKKEIGTYKQSKLSVEVSSVEEHYAIAETYRYRTVNEGGTNSALGSVGGFLSPPKYVRKYETFSIEEVTRKKIDEARSIIKIGDVAEQFEEDSTEEVYG